MQWCYLGRVGYQPALALQYALRDALGASGGAQSPTLLLLEHDPVITLGRSARPENVLVSAEARQRLGVELAQVGRGGDVTYHGPGQLVGYPLRRLRRQVREHVGAMIETLIAFLAERGVEARWREDHPGLWCDRGKIAAVGVDARGGIATHGFALNLQPRLADFQMIVPCGLQAPVTSLAALVGQEQAPTVEQAARLIGPALCRRYDDHAEEVSPDQLWRLIP